MSLRLSVPRQRLTDHTRNVFSLYSRKSSDFEATFGGHSGGAVATLPRHLIGKLVMWLTVFPHNSPTPAELCFSGIGGVKLTFGFRAWVTRAAPCQARAEAQPSWVAMMQGGQGGGGMTCEVWQRAQVKGEREGGKKSEEGEATDMSRR